MDTHDHPILAPSVHPLSCCTCVPQEENEDYQQVKDAFFKTLERAGESALLEKTHILLIMDAVNQLNPFYNAQTMDWFPTYLYVSRVPSPHPHPLLLLHCSP